MANTIISPNMNLILPTPGQELGPQYATDQNTSMSIIDQHNHSFGSGVPVTPNGLSINIDLPMQGNNLTQVKSVIFQSQSSPIPGTSPYLSCVYFAGGNLYVNDGNGVQIQMTINGAISGASGTITNLGPPNNSAGASYNQLAQTIVFLSNVGSNIPASLDVGNVIIRDVIPNSNGITLSAPPSLAGSYQLLLPASLPGAQSILTVNSAGQMSPAYTLDNSTINVSSGQIQVKPGGITQTQIAVGFGLIPTGALIPYGGTSAPTGFVNCDGTSYARTALPALFAAIGTAYGAADGAHFNVPDARGMFIRGVTGSSSNDPDAALRTANNAGGNTGNNVGSQQAAAVGPHTHPVGNQSNGTRAVGGVLGCVPGQAALAGGGDTGNPDSGNGGDTRPLNVYVNYIIKT